MSEKKRMMDTLVHLRAPNWLVRAAQQEAQRRALTLSALVRLALIDVVSSSAAEIPGRPRRPAPTGDQA